MIVRKLNESETIILEKLRKAFNKNDDLTNKQLTKLYKTLYEDVKSVKPFWIHPRAQEIGRPEEVFSEVEFKNGEKHYFYESCNKDNELVVTETEAFTDSEKEHFDYDI